jgi:hypothetical protein
MYFYAKQLIIWLRVKVLQILQLYKDKYDFNFYMPFCYVSLNTSVVNI